MLGANPPSFSAAVVWTYDDEMGDEGEDLEIRMISPSTSSSIASNTIPLLGKKLEEVYREVDLLFVF